MEDPLQSTIICLILLIIEALLSAAEISIFSVGDARLEALISEGRRSAQRIKTLQKEGALAVRQVSQFGHYLLHLLMGTLSISSWVMMPVDWIMSFSVPGYLVRIQEPAALIISVSVITLATAMVIFIFGYLLPRRWALQSPEEMALLLVRPFDALIGLLTPVYSVNAKALTLISRSLGDKGDAPQDEVTEPELKAFIAEHGAIATEEKKIIHSVFEFGDVSVGEVMVPRIDIEALEEQSTIDDALALFRETGYSRVPVYRETVDHIVGIINLKDILNAWMNGHKDDPVTTCLYRTTVVPEQKMALELLHEMQRDSNQMAIVTDEFGGTAGLITMEDLLEEVVGEIRDETDSDEQDDFTLISPSEIFAQGIAPVHDLNSELGWRLPEDEDYDTIGGLVFSHLGRIPQEGDSVEVDGYLLKVQKMDKRRIEMLHISIVNA